MKLRNKKTGEIKAVNHAKILIHFSDGTTQAIKSLAELNADWEDYKPAEPLIEDEKIRKAVKAWAEANEEEELDVKGGCLVTAFISLHKRIEIDFNCSWTRDGVYTIDELCGSEDE